MAFLRASIGPDPSPLIRAERLSLRPPQPGDYAAWAELRAESRAHLVPFEPQWSWDELSRAAFRRRLRFYGREIREDLGYAFLLFRNSDETLLGGLTLSNVRRGVTQAAALGYWLGRSHVGRGYMSEAVAATLRFAFGELKLHRIEAACMPHNAPSLAVLARTGFQTEGLARSYLRINGGWRDHVLLARLADDPPGGTP
jgi:ribosomal-protein-alanine N-acetyltransferase